MTITERYAHLAGSVLFESAAATGTTAELAANDTLRDVTVLDTDGDGFDPSFFSGAWGDVA